MDYSSIMKDYVAYMNRHKKDNLDAEMLGKIHSYRGEYLSYLFSCYYEDFLDSYIRRLKMEDIEDKKTPFFIEPRERKIQENQIKVKIIDLKTIYLEAFPVVKDEQSIYRPIEAVARNYEMQADSNQASIALWWHDEEYKSYYMQGKVCKDKGYSEGQLEVIPIPAGTYAIFSLEERRNTSHAEMLKELYFYAHTKWVVENPGIENEHGYNFQCFKDGKAYYCLSIKKVKKEDTLNKIYGVETWIDYIDNHLTENLTITSLAKKFNYSTTHFKRVFRMYYKMSVADYIRKRKLTKIAEEIRAGVDYMETSFLYGFKTYTGFSRAFKKEFHVSPAVYSKGMFEVIDLKKYYYQHRDSLRLSVVEMEEIHMIGHTVIPSKGAEVDIPAQVSYWIGKEFPCLKNTRYECNVAVQEDKIALWYQEEDSGDIEYILGPVVESFDEDIPKEMIKVTLQAGKYAIFETEKTTDEEDVAETLRMYTRCVFFGWIKEHRDRVDLTRLTFERYENGKIYLYVPVNY